MESDSNAHTTVIKHDQPVRVEIGESSDGRWFKLFHAVVESGLWAEMGPTAAKVLVVLAKHADDRWVAWPSMSSIMRLTGTPRASTYEAITWLEEKGLLQRRDRGGGRHSTTYQLSEPPVRCAGRVRSAGRVPSGAPDPCRPASRTPSRLIEQDSSNNSGASARRSRRGAPAPGQAAAVVESLIDCEIAEPTRSHLAQLPHITPALVGRVVEKTREKGGGVGAVVNGIRAACEKAGRDAERKRARRHAERQVIADIEQQHDQAATGEEREVGLAKMAEALGRRSRSIV